jgi:hypothetical protein
MSVLTPPKAVDVEVAAVQPAEADRAVLAHLRARENKSLQELVYLVKVRFETMPPVTSRGWALYVNNYRVPKYWAYKNGVYFKVFDPQFFEEHAGETLRFSLNGAEFIDTGLKLTRPKKQKAGSDPSRLPTQADALK